MILIAVGALGTAWLEWSNPATLGRLEPTDRVVNALFHSVSLRSAGFDSIGVGSLVDESLFLAIGLMFIGGASGSTAGGVKINTVAVLLVASWSAVRSGPSATAFGRASRTSSSTAASRSSSSVWRGHSSSRSRSSRPAACPSSGSCSKASRHWARWASPPASTQFSPGGQLLLTAAMFVGRLGPLVLVLALAQRTRPVAHRPAVEPVRIG